MPKVEKWSSKWIGIKMKSKGLQKLRWYCQMCEKQCRDENGFKQHRTSDQHQQMMAVFCQNPAQFMDEFSREFEKGFMLLMQTTYCKTRVLANDVYKEFIKDRHHLHMNSTVWVTLSGFVQYLGRTGKCTIEKTHKGWYVEYIDNSPEARKREQEKQARVEQEVTDADREKKMFDKLIKEGKASGGFQETEFTELQRTDDAPVQLKMNFGPTKPKSAALGNVFEETSSSHSRKRNAVEGIREDSKRPCVADDAAWVRPGIIVKVMHKTLADGLFFKKKGEILKVENTFGAEIRMSDSQKTIRCDQDDLETVIPAKSKPVAIVQGPHRGKTGVVVDVLIEEFSVVLQLEGERLQLKYEQVCKLA